MFRTMHQHCQLGVIFIIYLKGLNSSILAIKSVYIYVYPAQIYSKTHHSLHWPFRKNASFWKNRLEKWYDKHKQWSRQRRLVVQQLHWIHLELFLFFTDPLQKKTIILPWLQISSLKFALSFLSVNHACNKSLYLFIRIWILIFKANISSYFLSKLC